MAGAVKLRPTLSRVEPGMTSIEQRAVYTRRSLHIAISLLALFFALTSAISGFAGEVPLRTAAPEFHAKTWFNSPPLTLAELRGKVVLIDFWEYTCINCIRTFPYLRRWNRLYAPAGLVIIAVHTPEFEFAKNPTNVGKAVKRFGFTFPVAVDSDYAIWNAFHNAAWPADYLIDKDGRIAYMHIGEGDYGDTELEIRKLLKEARPKLDFAAAKYAIPANANDSMDSAVCHRATPETYLGFSRAAAMANPGGEDQTQEVHYVAPADVPLDNFALDGDWQAGDEYVRHLRGSPQSKGAVELHYQAKAVYLVAGSDDGSPKPLYVFQDGKPLPHDAWGVDIRSGADGRPYITLAGKRMYYVVNNPAFGEHLLRLTTASPGVSLYSFTFGNNCETTFAHK
jgi:thiol-disulfide isomerase/thioredoxin